MHALPCDEEFLALCAREHESAPLQSPVPESLAERIEMLAPWWRAPYRIARRWRPLAVQAAVATEPPVA
jgi:hypothetical protein